MILKSSFKIESRFKQIFILFLLFIVSVRIVLVIHIKPVARCKMLFHFMQIKRKYLCQVVIYWEISLKSWNAYNWIFITTYMKRLVSSVLLTILTGEYVFKQVNFHIMYTSSWILPEKKNFSTFIYRDVQQQHQQRDKKSFRAEWNIRSELYWT